MTRALSPQKQALLTHLSSWGFYNRVNRVPYYQRLFQQHDGVRQWNRGRSRYFLTPYYVVQYFTIGGMT